VGCCGAFNSAVGEAQTTMKKSSQSAPSRRRKRTHNNIAVSLSLPLLLAAIIIAAAVETPVDQIDIDYLIKVFCFVPCSPWTLYTGQEWIPGTNCEKYHNCVLGNPTSWAQCGEGLRFDPFSMHCEVASKVQCPGISTCPPTLTPTLAPSSLPSSLPSTEPTAYPTVSPTIPPVTIARDWIRSKRDAIENNVLVSYTNAGVAFPSTRYTFDGLMNGLDLMAIRGFGAGFTFNLWEGTANEWKKGILNLAAFLANAMVESIQYDSCDENNWQGVNGMYAISNSCGQEGYSYEDEECSLDFQSSCPVVSTMEVIAVNGPIGNSLPPPFQCKPGTNSAGYWDSSLGKVVTNAPYANDAGRKDIEGCCWWGRGALQTRGPCNIGKINFYLGKKGADMGRKTLYPSIDFCQFPEALCASADDKNLRWNSGLFEWAERIQRYNVDGWNYDTELNKFISEGMLSDSFITTVSRIVSRKCHIQGCSEFEVRMLDERIQNFFMIIDIFELRRLLATPNPTPIPTPRPNRPPTPKPNTITMNPTAKIQKTNPNESSSMPGKDESIISSDETQNKEPTYEPTFADGLIRLDDNAARRTSYKLAPLLIASILLSCRL